MDAEKLAVQVAFQIGKPAEEVFEAIVDPAHMSRYFISAGSGRMEEGQTVVWEFPEFEGEAPVRVGKIEPNRLVSFYWTIDDLEMLTEIKLEPFSDHSTVVKIREGERDNDSAGIRWLKGNTEGWANFLCCLKAYLEHGINLRKGGFDFRWNQPV